MRINRLVLTLLPFVAGACSDPTNPNDGTGPITVGMGGTAGAMGGLPQSGGGNGTVITGGGASSTGVPATGAPGGAGPTGMAGTTSGGTPGTPTGGGTTAGGGAAPTGAGGTMTGGGTSGGGASTGGVGTGGAGGTVAGPQTCPYTPPEEPSSYPDGWTSSEVTVFNDNGGWTWYNDERVVVDAEGGKIVVSSAASSASSQTADTSIHVVVHDLATGMNQKTSVGSLSYSDDHNNGGILVKRPGEYFVGWAHHNVDCNSYYANYADGSWGQSVTWPWGQGCPWGTRPDNITYNNPWNMSAEGIYYNFIRSVQTSPNFLYSEDDGVTWTYGGRLTASPQQGYNAGYLKYWGNGVDRIDFFSTEAHPRDANTSLYHGYVQGRKSYDSFGVEQDDNLFDGNAPQVTAFTTVFQAGGSVGGVSVRRLWNFDIARYDDGTIGVLWQGRENECADKNNCNPGHHILYSRFDGTEWKSTRLVKGGRTLYRNRSDWWEEDYLGGAALDPDNPHVIYVSTPIDPRDDTTDHGNHEIWKGVTCDDGASFTWTPMTMNSPDENLRPVVPKWDANNTALLWFRGSYQTAQMYDAEVVGLIMQE